MARVTISGKALNSLFDQRKDLGIVIPAINKYLNTVSFDNDRGHGLNSPSSVSQCIRSSFYNRKGYKRDVTHNEPRVQRIFDNGTYTHERLQDYLMKSGILLLDEAPVYNKVFQIMGHSDGILKLEKGLGILEIKTINSNGFSNLITTKPEHIEQAHVYLYCMEELRKQLHSFDDFKEYFLKEMESFLETFVVTGKKYTKRQKIFFQMSVWEELIELLENCNYPIDTMIFLYENKDTQELKEFIVKRDEEIIGKILDKYRELNKYVKSGEVPPRPQEATSRGCRLCNNCLYKIECWN